jgi:N6-adenosine-specific RNA methylase IME4
MSDSPSLLAAQAVSPTEGRDLERAPAPFENLKHRHYGVILADPPWPMQTWSEAGLGKSPERHYPTMSNEAIMALPVWELAAENCALILWHRWINPQAALDVIKAWGFTQVSGGSWQKRTVNLKPTFGTGYYYRNSSEPYYLAVRGRAGRGSRSVRDSMTTALEFATGLDGVRREHSRKPPEMRQNIDAMWPDVPGVELFAREPWHHPKGLRDVWSGTGEESKFATLAPPHRHGFAAPPLPQDRPGGEERAEALARPYFISSKGLPAGGQAK